jgi:hypothetical protein
MKKIKGYKAFHKDMTCNGFKFKEGEVYEEDRAIICKRGFHFCENPLDVLNYYDLIDSNFHEVEALGDIDKQGDDTKVCTTKIKIGAKLDLPAYIKASIDFMMEKCKPIKGDKTDNKSSAKLASSGDSAKLASSGNFSQLASSGNFSQLASSGYSAKLASSGYSAKLASSGNYAKLEVNGKYSVGAGIGINNIIKGEKGSWITLSEWKYDNKISKWKPVCVKSAQIDGKKLKVDTFYKLENKKFVEVA